MRSQTFISGVINDPKQVVSINIPTSTVTLNTVAGLAIKDTVLLIQMKGAVISTNNSSAYGDVNDYNGAGRYELATICQINGNDITFTASLENTDYDASGSMQLIKVPKYDNATVTDTLTAPAWNGTTGGVLVLEVSGTLMLNADIDVSGKGFLGGQHDESTYNCTFLDDYSDYEYPLSGGLGAMKGEGIAPYSSGNGGRGALANGGGGGNDHNAGGGGGSNITAGGDGGENDDPGMFNCNGFYPGIGGKPLVSNGDRLFLGGGGGAGHSNSIWVTSGGNGGGMAIILAGTITGNGNYIRANGANGEKGLGDGAAGGGAGGTVELEASSYSTSLNIEANGGNGADSDGFPGARCFGPGGGGSGGCIRFSDPSQPGNVNVSYNGGTNGVVTNSTAGCLGDNMNSIPGQAGMTFYDNNMPFNDEGSDNEDLAPKVDLGPDVTICDGQSQGLDAGTEGNIYNWSTGAGTQVISVGQSGSYWVEVSNGGCKGYDTIYVDVALAPTEYPPDTATLCSYEGVELDAGNPGMTYNWSTGETSRVINVNKEKTYSVTITGSPGCTITQDIKVTACLNNIDLPNTITPNGDGFNDSWIVPGIYGYPGNTVRIFNRNGNLVHEATDYNNDWDGQGLPATAYYYILDLNNGGNVQHGSITIIREK